MYQCNVRMDIYVEINLLTDISHPFPVHVLKQFTISLAFQIPMSLNVLRAVTQRMEVQMGLHETRVGLAGLAYSRGRDHK